MSLFVTCTVLAWLQVCQKIYVFSSGSLFTYFGHIFNSYSITLKEYSFFSHILTRLVFTVVEWLALVQFPVESFLCGVWIFSQCMYGFPPGILAFSHSLKAYFIVKLCSH